MSGITYYHTVTVCMGCGKSENLYTTNQGKFCSTCGPSVPVGSQENYLEKKRKERIDIEIDILNRMLKSEDYLSAFILYIKEGSDIEIIKQCTKYSIDMKSSGFYFPSVFTSKLEQELLNKNYTTTLCKNEYNKIKIKEIYTMPAFLKLKLADMSNDEIVNMFADQCSEVIPEQHKNVEGGWSALNPWTALRDQYSAKPYVLFYVTRNLYQ